MPVDPLDVFRVPPELLERLRQLQALRHALGPHHQYPGLQQFGGPQQFGASPRPAHLVGQTSPFATDLQGAVAPLGGMGGPMMPPAGPLGPLPPILGLFPGITNPRFAGPAPRIRPPR